MDVDAAALAATAAALETIKPTPPKASEVVSTGPIAGGMGSLLSDIKVGEIVIVTCLYLFNTDKDMSYVGWWF